MVIYNNNNNNNNNNINDHDFFKRRQHIDFIQLNKLNEIFEPIFKEEKKNPE